jgi:hypothetical protein
MLSPLEYPISFLNDYLLFTYFIYFENMCLLSNGYRGPFLRGKAWLGRDTDHSPHLVPRSWMSRSYISSPPHASIGMSWDCFTVYWFTLFFSLLMNLASVINTICNYFLPVTYLSYHYQNLLFREKQMNSNSLCSCRYKYIVAELFSIHRQKSLFHVQYFIKYSLH